MTIAVVIIVVGIALYVAGAYWCAPLIANTKGGVIIVFILCWLQFAAIAASIY